MPPPGYFTGIALQAFGSVAVPLVMVCLTGVMAEGDVAIGQQNPSWPCQLVKLPISKSIFGQGLFCAWAKQENKRMAGRSHRFRFFGMLRFIERVCRTVKKISQYPAEIRV